MTIKRIIKNNKEIKKWKFFLDKKFQKFQKLIYLLRNLQKKFKKLKSDL